MPFLTYDPFPQCLQQSPLTPLLLARVTGEEVGAIYQTLSVSGARSSCREKEQGAALAPSASLPRGAIACKQTITPLAYQHSDDKISYYYVISNTSSHSH